VHDGSSGNSGAEREDAMPAMTGHAGYFGQLFTVLGLGRSGQAAADALTEAGAAVRLYDEDTSGPLRERMTARYGDRAPLLAGPLPEPRPGEVHVVSPGFVADSPDYLRLQAAGATLVDETEIFYRLMLGRFPGRPVPVIGITGTNGKTTTTELVSHLLAQAGRHVITGGNIGVPLCSQLPQLRQDSVVVAELSEIHLLGGDAFRCDVAVITNIDYDHVIGLPVFGGVPSAYHDCKWRITRNLTARDTLVYFADCPITAEFVRSRPLDCRMEPASAQRDPGRGWRLDRDGFRRFGDGPGSRLVARREDVSTRTGDGEQLLLGEHNHANALLALAAVSALGEVSDEALRRGLSSFGPPAHRINLLPGMPDGLVIIDDSKATNPHAVLAALAVVRRTYPAHRIIWIGGGQSDQAPKDDLVRQLPQLAQAAVLVGQSGPQYQELLRGTLPAQVTASMDEAAAAALRQAAGRPSVLLFSPAAKSFDMYDSYAHRARAFREAITRELDTARASPLAGPADSNHTATRPSG
jgi:UDP-N-acetylmuramoylalanine--D-glutamate ligase